MLLRACSPDGAAIGTLVLLRDRRRMYIWSGGSAREHLALQPNEALVWEANRRAGALGLEELDLGGGGAYKEKYGVHVVAVPVFRRSHPALIATLRDAARDALKLRRRVEGRLRDGVASRRARRGGAGRRRVAGGPAAGTAVQPRLSDGR